MQGKIIKGIAGFYYVHVVEFGVYECKAKGVFRKEKIKPLVGDNVEIEILDESEKKGNIVKILPRQNELIRPAVANIDQALVVFAITKPNPHFNLLDRFLIMMRYQGVPVTICFNKADLDGVEVIHRVRTWSNLPIIVISARSEDTDKIEALDAGADDYLTKPFSVEELLARLRVTQRRLATLQAGVVNEGAVFTNGRLKVDYAAGCAFLGEEELHLTPSEYKLLCLLCKNVGKVLTHTFIAQQIWGRSWENDVASLRVYMATLRKKLERDPDSPQYIQTHIGVGYRMLKVE